MSFSVCQAAQHQICGLTASFQHTCHQTVAVTEARKAAIVSTTLSFVFFQALLDVLDFFRFHIFQLAAHLVELFHQTFGRADSQLLKEQFRRVVILFHRFFVTFHTKEAFDLDALPFIERIQAACRLTEEQCLLVVTFFDQTVA